MAFFFEVSGLGKHLLTPLMLVVCWGRMEVQEWRGCGYEYLCL